MEYIATIEKVYRVWRIPSSGEESESSVIAEVNGIPLKHVMHHSLAGFEFGYGGSGPADLALSILADHFNEMNSGPLHLRRLGVELKCVRYHQTFKWRFIASATGDRLEITSQQIEQWIRDGCKEDE